ncbi:MAG: LysM peptidoglycan-binding domain-containing protein [Bacteroidales bacterium]|nr:LysM peptidoglycan-binding domain-containing protein [Bacteroidales bacterium]
MTLYKKILATLTVAVALMTASAALAQVDTLPIKTVDGVAYHYYVVQSKETVYSLCKRFGVSREEMERYNPSVADGLKAGQTLLFPASQEAAIKASTTHEVKKGETLYGISRQYGVSIDQILAWNPSARDGLKTGQMLIVGTPTTPTTPTTATSETTAPTATTVTTATTAATPTTDNDIPGITYQINPPRVGREEVDVPEANPQYTTYVVHKGETFYSIARAHDLTVEQLEQANPEVGVLKEGMKLNIPIKNCPTTPSAATPAMAATAQPAEPAAVANERAVEPAPTDTLAPLAPAVTKPEGINIALMLPLMASNDPQPRQAQLYTEFYKGFLLAVDSLRNNGTPIHLQVYDTEGSLATVKSILEKPELQQVEMIVAPDNEEQLREIGSYGAAHGINVINLFVVKDESYANNPYVMQANIPHSEMYRKAIQGMSDRFARYTPVILIRKDGDQDKSAFINQMKASLTEQGKPFELIEFEGLLTMTDLKGLDTSGAYAFIPASGKQTELTYVLPALLEFRERATDYDPVHLMGYPEWTTFKGETLINMHKLNALVYSRFYEVPDDPAVKELEGRYKRWYGEDMSKAVPRQGLFGFDTGMFLIRSLRANRGDYTSYTPTYKGLQNGFDFTRPAGVAGHINEQLYFINFRPSGLIDKISL